MGKKNRKQPATAPGQGSRKKPPEKAKPASLKVRETIESIVVAIIFVLVIRQYSAETFDIPTASMSPTLLGAQDEHGQRARQGDRLIGDKMYYRYHPVDRYDIVIFKDPVAVIKNGRHEEHKTLIKRFVGLPYEIIEIMHGDLYVLNGELKWEIPEKPPAVQDAMWRNIPEKDATDMVSALSDWNLASKANAVMASKTDEGLVFDMRSKGDATYSHDAPVDDTPPNDAAFAANAVTDLLVEITVHPLSSGGAVELVIVEEGNRYTLRLPVSGSSEKASLSLELKQPIREGLAAGEMHAERSDISLPVNKTSTISLTNADDRIVARLNGKEIFRSYAPVEPAYRNDSDFEAKLAQKGKSGAAFTLSECRARLGRLRLARDVYYTDAFYAPVEEENGGFVMATQDVAKRKPVAELVVMYPEGSELPILVKKDADGKFNLPDGKGVTDVIYAPVEEHNGEFIRVTQDPAKRKPCQQIRVNFGGRNIFVYRDGNGRFILPNGKPVTRDMEVLGVLPLLGLVPDLAYAVTAPYKMGEDEFFAMGDNSPGSYDSRFWAAVPRKYILAKAVVLFWPFPPFSKEFRPRFAH